MGVWQDSCGGLRIDRNCRGLDMQRRPIPGLFAGGEACGGGQMHGLGRATLHGFIAGKHVVKKTSTDATLQSCEIALEPAEIDAGTGMTVTGHLPDAPAGTVREIRDDTGTLRGSAALQPGGGPDAP